MIGWKNSLEFSKVWPRNFASCAAGGDCSPRFPYGQKDSYHYVLFGHSLAIPAWNTRYADIDIHQCCRRQHNHHCHHRPWGEGNHQLLPEPHHGLRHTGNAEASTACTTHRRVPTPRTIIMATPAGVTMNWSYPKQHAARTRHWHHLRHCDQHLRLLRSRRRGLRRHPRPLGDSSKPGHEQARHRHRRHAVPRTRPHHRPQPRRPLLRQPAITSPPSKPTASPTTRAA